MHGGSYAPETPGQLMITLWRAPLARTTSRNVRCAKSIPSGLGFGTTSMATTWSNPTPSWSAPARGIAWHRSADSFDTQVPPRPWTGPTGVGAGSPSPARSTHGTGSGSIPQYPIVGDGPTSDEGAAAGDVSPAPA